MQRTITIQNTGLRLNAEDGARLLDVLRAHDLAPEAPCGGNGSCKKCRVLDPGADAQRDQWDRDADLRREQYALQPLRIG